MLMDVLGAFPGKERRPSRDGRNMSLGTELYSFCCTLFFEGGAPISLESPPVIVMSGRLRLGIGRSKYDVFRVKHLPIMVWYSA